MFLCHRQGNRSQYGSDGEPTSTNAKKRIKEFREVNEELKLLAAGCLMELLY